MEKGETFSLIIRNVGFSGERTLGLRSISVTGDVTYNGTYPTVYEGNETANATVQHKRAKWYDIRTNKGYDESDTFGKDDDTETGMEGKVKLIDNNTLVQAAHVYVDTIYMVKGTSMTILLPSTKSANNSSISNYFRWYNYRNDNNFYCGGNTVGSSNGEDLLTPSSGYIGWRFANGYVSGTLNYQTSNINSSDTYSQTYTLRQVTFYYPTDDEFSNISSSLGQSDNGYYAVACDVSIYSDFEEVSQYGGADFGSTTDVSGNTTYWEPTLAGRMLYYIVGIDNNTGTANSTTPEQFKHYEKLFTDTSYKGGNTSDTGKNYLEEFEITFPSRRISNNTNELIALTKDAQSYGVPGETSQGSDYVFVTLINDDPDNALTLATTSLRGANRVIYFYKDSSGAQWTVPNNTTATILVTKYYNYTYYNIARYKITFKDECIPLTEVQVAGLKNITDTATCTYWWKNLTYRSPEYIKKNYERLDALNFDYSSDINAYTVLDGQSQNYPYPMNWDESSYAFYDGSDGDDVYPYNSTSGTSPAYSLHTNFSMYSLVNDYIGYSDVRTGRNNPSSPQCSTLIGKTEKNHDGYWIYVDASDRPGTLAELTLDEALCPGAEIIVSAWIKSAGYGSSTSDADAAVLFTVMGVDESGNHVPIYRQCSGQIRTTMGLTDQLDEDDLPNTVTGKGEGTNEWFQLYFTFKNVGSRYSSYTIKIDNYCSSTSGGDFYIDQIEAYVAQPTVEVTPITPLCSDTKVTEIRLDLDYETIMARYGEDVADYGKGDETSSDTKNSVDFIIIDRYKYDTYVDEHQGEEELIINAIKKSIVELSLDDDSQSEQFPTKFPTLSFYYFYGKNNEYGDETTYPYDGYFLYSENTATGVISLSADFYASLSSYTPYQIILITEVEDYSNLSEDEKIKLYADELEGSNTTCTISSYFYATATTTLHINGALADPTLTYCEGQSLHISPTFTYTDANGDTQTLEDEYFDWFFGTEDEFTSAPSQDAKYNGVTLQNALLDFRDVYKETAELADSYDTYKNDELNYDESNAVIFTEYDYNVMKYWLTKEYGETGSGSYYLVLYQQYMDIVVSSPALTLVVQPIEVDIDVEEETNDETANQVKAYAPGDQNNQGGPGEDGPGGPGEGGSGEGEGDDEEETESIEVCFGYVTLVLQANGEAPSLKLGFYNVKYPDDYTPWLRIGLGQINNTSASNTIKVNLHGAKYSSSEDVDHIGTVKDDESDVDYTQLFLIDTNDPDYQSQITEYFEEYDLPVGYISELHGEESETEDLSYMNIYFNSDFTPKEGYHYTLTVHFQEKADQDETATTNSCYGTFPMEMKIVPEYLVWQGTRADNWNDDTMWKRASNDELNKTDDDTDDNGTYNGYVPMLFSKVVMPKDSEAELYMAGFKEDKSTNMYDWSGEDNKSEAITGEPTENIMYDMMVYEDASNSNALSTERYRVNLCNELYLPVGAKLLHSELLICDTVRLDVEVPQSEWTLMSLPLNGVVSGDWYTKTSGKETEEYFKSITFNSSENNRYNPMVYQRSWNNSSAVIVNSSNGNVPSYSSTGWTSVYNDASVVYNAGDGVSIKAYLNGGSSSGDNLVFRFPKSDTKYNYSSSSTLDRTDAGKLKIAEEMVDRSKPDNDSGDVYGDNVSVVTLTPTAANEDNIGYCIVGNPFTSYMSMSKFFEANSNVLKDGYYLDKSDTGPIFGNDVFNSLGGSDYALPPYGAFFVAVDENAGSNSTVDIKFTKDMQVLSSDDVSQLKAFSIRAANSVGISSAAFAYFDNATDEYSASEDVVLLEDASWSKSGMPMVYTVAGDKAVSVNSLKSEKVIPLGVFADDDCVYTLTFVGVDNIEDPVLYDAVLDTETSLTEGFVLDMQGASYGRYFIRTAGSSTNDIQEIEDAKYSVTVYSPARNTVVVSSDTEINSVEVYSIGGAMLKRAILDGRNSCVLYDINCDVAIVKVYTKEGSHVSKLKVKS
ncbi:MAG: hypothetical protein LUC91_08225 [Prevotella sp.]|nr:hypothetical protein [Prevotella sp.]